MKAYRWTVSVIWMLPLLLSPAAQAESARGLTSTQVQRLSRDLVPFSSEDFFRKGREQLDRELELLRRLPNLPERVLKIAPQAQYPRDDRSTFWEPAVPPANDRSEFK